MGKEARGVCLLESGERWHDTIGNQATTSEKRPRYRLAQWRNVLRNVE